MSSIYGIGPATTSSSGFSILKTANKEPELALQLLMKTLAATQSAVQATQRSVSPSVLPQGVGGNINTVA